MKFELQRTKVDSIEVSQVYMYDDSGEPLRGINVEYLKTYIKTYMSSKDNSLLREMYVWLQQNYPELLL